MTNPIALPLKMLPAPSVPKMVPVSYVEIPEEQIAELETLIADLKSGRVTAFAGVSAGPEFARYGGGFVQTHMDHMAILAALSMKTRQLQDLEIERYGI